MDKLADLVEQMREEESAEFFASRSQDEEDDAQHDPDEEYEEPPPNPVRLWWAAHYDLEALRDAVPRFHLRPSARRPGCASLYHAGSAENFRELLPIAATAVAELRGCDLAELARDVRAQAEVLGRDRQPTRYRIAALVIEAPDRLDEIPEWLLTEVPAAVVELLARLARRDGPAEDGCSFWWQGERHDVAPNAYKLLRLVWDAESVPYAAVHAAIPDHNDASIRSLATSKLNPILRAAGVPWKLASKGGRLYKRPHGPTAKSPESPRANAA